jgi:hypothetical protein
MEFLHMKQRIITAAVFTALCIQGIACADDGRPLSIVFDGLIEIEASHSSPYVGGSSSDIVVATAELGASVMVNDQVSAGISLLYEEDDTDLEVDVATLTYSPTEANWSITAGQLYVPFGSYQTNMVSDPLTLEIGETRETVARFDIESGILSAAIYLFNGTNKKNNGADNKADNFGLNLGYTIEGQVNITGSVGYINDIGDSDGLQSGLAIMFRTMLPGSV